MKYHVRPTFNGSGFATLDDLPNVSFFVTGTTLTTTLSGYVTTALYAQDKAALQERITALENRKRWADF